MVSTALIEREYKGVGNEYTGRFCGKTKAGPLCGLQMKAGQLEDTWWEGRWRRRSWSFSSLWSPVTCGGFTRTAQMAGHNLHLHPTPPPSLLLVPPLCFASSKYASSGIVKVMQGPTGKVGSDFWWRQQWRPQNPSWKRTNSCGSQSRIVSLNEAYISLNKTSVFLTRPPPPPCFHCLITHQLLVQIICTKTEICNTEFVFVELTL